MAFTISAPAQLTDLEKQALEAHRVSSIPSNQKHVDVLNPPYGSIDKKIQDQVTQIKKIVEKLASEEYLKRNYGYFITINSSEIPKVRVVNYDNYFREFWQGRELNTHWPVYDRLGYKPDKNLHEINISVGTLRKISNVSELAFLIAHEISRAFEDLELKEEKDRDKQWGDQRKFIIADQKALNLMLGKFRLESSLVIIDKIERSRITDKSRGSWEIYSDFLKSMPHEGLRISATQVYLDYLLKTRSEARDPIIINYKPYRGTAYPVVSQESEFSKNLEAQRKLIKKYFVFSFGEEFLTPNKQLDTTKYPGLIPPLPNEFERELIWFIEELKNNKKINYQEKINRFFAWYAYFKTNVFQTHQVKSNFELQRWTRTNIAKLFLEAKKNAWSLTESLELFEKYKLNSGSPSAASYISRFFFESETSSFMDSIIRVNPDYAHQILNDYYDFKFSTEEKHSRAYFNTIYNLKLFLTENDTLKKEKKASKWLYFQRNKMLSVLLSKGYENHLYSLQVTDKKRFLDHQALIQKYITKYELPGPIKKAFVSHQKLLDPFRIEIMRQSTLPSSEISFITINNIFRSTLPMMNQSKIPQVTKHFIHLAHQHLNAQIKFEENEMIHEERKSAISRIITEILNISQLNPGKRSLLLKYMAAHLSSSFDLETKTNEDREQVRKTQKAISYLTRGSFLMLFDYPLDELEKEIAKIYNDRQLLDLKSIREEENRNFKRDIKKWKKSGKPFGVYFKDVTSPGIDYVSMTRLSQVAQLEDIRVNSSLSLLMLVGENPVLSERLSKELSAIDLKSIVNRVSKLSWEGQRPQRYFEGFANIRRPSNRLSPSAGKFLLETLQSNGASLSLKDWHDTFKSIMNYSKKSLDKKIGLREQLQKQFLEKLRPLPIQKQMVFIEKLSSLLLLDNRQTIEKLVLYIDHITKNHYDEKTRATLIVSFIERMDLKVQLPDLYNDFRNSLSKHLSLQPHQIELYFPDSKKTWSNQSSAFSMELRGLSTLVSLTREQNPATQMRTLEYFMGKTNNYPSFLIEASRDLKSGFSIDSSVRSLREKMASANIMERTIVANSFLAGPSGLPASQAGLDFILNRLLNSIDSENLEFTKKVARAILRSDGLSSSLSIAYILAQKSNHAKSSLSEGELLKAAFESKGVPGIKLGQYLAFTAPNEDLRRNLSKLQDSAKELNYFETLQLVNNRFKNNWPKSLIILGTLGSGSVNVAVEYLENGKKASEVLSLLRDSIEHSTKEDFLRLEKVISELNRTSEDRKTFGYLQGLLNIIFKSVELEFDKKNAFEVQKSLGPIYRAQRNGWTVKTLDVRSFNDVAVFMEKAEGVTARKILDRDKKLYAEIMTILSRTELDILLGLDKNSNSVTKAMFANPDFHDGQVIVDKIRKVIVVLDFGQALPISNSEREIGLDLLRIISRSVGPKRAAKLVHKITGYSAFTIDKMRQLYSSYPERMEIFVHLIAKLSMNGTELPLSTIHWILGMNRQISLGEKIGKPITSELVRLLTLRGIGLSIKHHNWLNQKIVLPILRMKEKLSCKSKY
ncbi:MAG: hypothetical protein AB8E15_00200 [Bdellovibrionales bacterium]